MKQSDLLKILTILSKYVKDKDELSCGPYEIYMSPGKRDLSEGDVRKLEGLGVRWNDEYECWEVFF